MSDDAETFCQRPVAAAALFLLKKQIYLFQTSKKQVQFREPYFLLTWLAILLSKELLFLEWRLLVQSTLLLKKICMFW